MKHVTMKAGAPEEPAVSWEFALGRARRLHRLPLSRAFVTELVVLGASIGTTAPAVVTCAVIALATMTGALLYTTRTVPFLLDPLASWRWLRRQLPLSIGTAVGQLLWKGYLIVVALGAWFCAVLLESDFDARRAAATTDDEMSEALWQLVSPVLQFIAVVTSTVPAVWLALLIRRGERDESLPAEGFRPWHLALAWLGVLILLSATVAGPPLGFATAS